jgi:indole-3-glycerol phosphate synthase
MLIEELVVDPQIVMQARAETLTQRKARTPIEAVRALASMQKRPLPFLNTVTDDSAMLLIGQVRYSQRTDGYDPVAMALRFAAAGADAIALFTDDSLYPADLDDLVMLSRAVSIPVIGQNYYTDEYQIVEARAAGASALMLYAGLVDHSLLRTLVSSTQRNRMTAVVEVHDLDELDYALGLSPYVISLSSARPGQGPGAIINLHALRDRIPVGTHAILSDPLYTLDQVAAARALHVEAVIVHESLLGLPGGLAQVR